MKEKLLKLIQDSDYNTIQKIVMGNVIHRHYEQKDELNAIDDLVRNVGQTDKIFELILNCSDLIIYKEASAEFRFIFKSVEKWKRSHWVAESLDQVLLYYLAEKYEGTNSRFPMYAYRMLDMDNKY